MTTGKPSPAHSRRWVVVVGLGLAVAAGVAWYVWPARVPGVTPPEVALDGVDPAIAQTIRAAREEVVQSPRSAAAWGGFGEVLDAHVFKPEAVACYAQAERLDPNEPRWPYLQGMILFPDDADAGLAKLRRAAELTPEKPDTARYRLAELLLTAERPAEARAAFEDVLRTDPNHPLARLGMARLKLAAGDFDGCARYAGAALNSPHSQRATHTLLAEMRHRQGDAAGAAAEQQRASESPPDRPWPDPFRKGLNERRKVGRAGRIAHANELMDGGQYPAAAAELKRIVADYPASAEAWIRLGYALVVLNDNAAAEKALAEALRLDAGQPRAHFYLGVVLHRRGDRTGAAARFREAIAAKPDYLEAHFNLGMTLKEDGKRAVAIEAFLDAVRCQPTQAPAHGQLGELLVQEGRPDDARRHLEEALRLNPRDRRVSELLTSIGKGGSK